MNIETLTKEHPHLVTQLRQEGVTAERERIKGIVGCEAAVGREQLARELAFTTDINAHEACLLLEHAPQNEAKPTTSFEKVMAGIPNPDVAPGGANEGADDVEATAKRLASY